MINYTHSDLFATGSVSKKLLISFDDTTITNGQIYQEGFELKESLCSENELRFGSCEASMLKLKIRNEFGVLKGKWFDVSMVLGENTAEPFHFGKYKADSCELSGDKKYVNITAYDSMYDIINADVVEWYDALEFPVTLKVFRDSFFTQVGVEQETTSLIQDDILIEKTIDADSISGLKVINAICELNGVFGHINRQGVFEYVSLAQNATPVVTYTKYSSCEYEDFTTSGITKVQVRQEEGDIGAVSGTGTNCYIVNDNFLVYGKSPDNLATICDRLLAKIANISYVPFKASVQANPCVEVGDNIKISTKTKDITSYLLERSIKGIQALKDSFESQGVYEYAEKVNSANHETRQLKGKINKLTRTVDETISELKDVETGFGTQIHQNTEQIKLMATKEDVSNIQVGARNLIRNSINLIYPDYYFSNEAGLTFILDELGNRLLDESGNTLVI